MKREVEIWHVFYQYMENSGTDWLYVDFQHHSLCTQMENVPPKKRYSPGQAYKLSSVFASFRKHKINDIWQDNNVLPSR